MSGVLPAWINGVGGRRKHVLRDYDLATTFSRWQHKAWMLCYREYENAGYLDAVSLIGTDLSRLAGSKESTDRTSRVRARAPDLSSAVSCYLHVVWVLKIRFSKNGCGAHVGLWV